MPFQIKQLILLLVGVAIAFAGGFLLWNWYLAGVSAPAPNQETPPQNVTEKGKSDLIRVENIIAGQIIQSPLRVTGEARGFWFFEASFPVRVYDGEGNVWAATVAQAKSEWMTEDFVPFEAELTFSAPTTDSGILVLEKDNPSGLPENADELRIPVRFR